MQEMWIPRQIKEQCQKSKQKRWPKKVLKSSGYTGLKEKKKMGNKTNIKVDLTREEVTSYHRQVMRASTEDNKWTFVVGFSDTQIAEIEEVCKDKLDTREYKEVSAAYPFIEASIWHKLKINPSKVATFDPEGLALLPDVIEAFRGKLCDLMGLAGYQPKQKTIEEMA